MLGVASRRLLAIFVALGLITSAWVLWTRSRVPQGGPESELVVRLETVYESARLHGIPVDDLLDSFREAGVTTIAVEAKSLVRLEYAGQVAVVSDPVSGFYSVKVFGDERPRDGGSAGGSGTGLASADLEVWLAKELARWAPRGVEPGGLGPGSLAAPVPAFYPAPRKDRVPPPEEVFLPTGDPLAAAVPERDLILGLSPADVEMARRHGFLVAAFIPNRPDITPGEALAMLEGLGDGAGFSAVKFDSPTALGWPDPEALRVVGAKLRELGLAFVIDDKPQPGLATVAEAAGWSGVRQQPVWTRSEPARFPEVARERRQNFLYLQSAFFDGTSPDWLAQVTAGLEAIVRAMDESGLKMGRAVPLTAYDPPRPALALMVSGVFAAAILGFLLVTESAGRVGGPGSAASGPPASGPPEWRRLLTLGLILAWALPVLATLAGGDSGLVLGVQLLAGLAAALTFPLLAVGLALRLGPGRPAGVGRDLDLGQGRVGGLAGALRAALLAALVAGVATAGGLLIAAIGSNTSFMLRLTMFLGTKLSLLLPPVLAGFLFLGMVGLYPDGAGAGRTGTDRSEVGRPEADRRPEGPAERIAGRSFLERGLRELQRIMNENVTFVHVFLFGLAAVAALILVMRSGNFPTLGISGLELKVRAFLQQALLVRPRTKEFLIGYPALVLLFWWGPRWRLDARWRWAALVLTVAAAVGLTSIGNTFAHQHIPVSVSLLRTVNGLVLGLPIGLALVVVARAASWVGRRLAAIGPAAAGEGNPQREETR
jgi:hypothetical protein